MKVNEMMDKDFIVVSPDDNLVEVSILMEKKLRFTTPVVDDQKRLVGWITSLDVTRGFREGMKKVKEVMYAKEDIVAVNEDDPARLAVLEASEYKVFNIPVINDDDVVVGVVRTFDIVKTLSSLYEIKVYKIFEAMEEELKGVTWEELMEASAIVTRRRTGKRVTAQDYEKRIRESTFGEAIWATGGLEKFFVGLIAIGELVIARKVAQARK
ncbi:MULTISPECIES: HPP family protein [Methanobacterium]|jgi:predicted transcriptional regulator|uniref:CBS domain-containing protein n=2 Tax=Methanobacterium TaxID=2160 RepID=A0A089ZGF5_METFO|nr:MULTISPECIES: CBS domain-containing protein [Methanobacterium]AIS32155.1 CBS domain-containing protein [Methanobacterium formicicum]AXV39265.1 MAG: CBS domain-containing protein [Methanobacterium sp. BAmetb5]KUK75295.1 MAG: CBS domain-containing protein [Methanobacterium sp. 42_16]MBF4475329.1 CBS domain-containing protein [Methanobacterium formicicum]MDD4811159.1 CBS domain-containing protein [Methanobacterium formicicum]